MEEWTREAVEGVPVRSLRSVISRYRGYHRVGPSGVHRGLPSSALTFVVSLADPVDVLGLPEAGRSPGAVRAFVAGLHTGPAQIHHDGLQFGIQMDVTPLGARCLFGVPAGELAHSVVPLDELFGSESPLLVERLDAARSWPDRFRVLDEVLARRLADTGAAHPAVAEAWRALARGGGDLTVSALATQVGYSRRHLAELFNREFGLSPRTAARVLRFERSRSLLRHSAHRQLAAVAAVAGYCDQAHMSHEWSALAGCAPSAWVAEELPFVQDVDVLGAHHRVHEHTVRA